MTLVGFVGSRSRLPRGSAALVRRCVSAVFASSHAVAVGCASGADSAVLSAALAALPAPRHSGAWLYVFAAFGPQGEGALPNGLSAVALVCQGAAPLAVPPGHGLAAPVSVSWVAGSSPLAPPAARLAARRSALVRAVAASGPGCGLVAFLTQPSCSPSSGSFLAMQEAAGLGVPVVAFPLGFPASSLPSLGAGSWSPASAPAGSPWSDAFHWVPAQWALL